MDTSLFTNTQNSIAVIYSVVENKRDTFYKSTFLTNGTIILNLFETIQTI